MTNSTCFRGALVLWVLPFCMALKCDNQQAPPPVQQVELRASPLAVGAVVRATLTEEAVTPRFLAQQKARRIGQVRAVETTSKTRAEFEAELLAEQPERWRVTVKSFERTSQTAGGHAATASHGLDGGSFEVEHTEPPTVLLADGTAVTEPQARALLAITKTLAERHAWEKFVASRPFTQGQIIAAPKVVAGNFVGQSFGALSDANMTVSFQRFDAVGEDEVVVFDVHQSFRATQPNVEDGSYMEFETNGQLRTRQADGRLLGYELSGKATPRAATGEMLPEGSGSWSVRFAVDP